MECKLYTAGIDLRLIAELIDTLWNVNVNPNEVSIKNDNELIDTLWNVNDVSVSLQ